MGEITKTVYKPTAVVPIMINKIKNNKKLERRVTYLTHDVLWWPLKSFQREMSNVKFEFDDLCGNLTLWKKI